MSATWCCAYDPIQGQDHETVQVRNAPSFTFPLLHHLQYEFDRAGFLVLVFGVMWLWTWKKITMWGIGHHFYMGWFFCSFLLWHCCTGADDNCRVVVEMMERGCRASVAMLILQSWRLSAESSTRFQCLAVHTDCQDGIVISYVSFFNLRKIAHKRTQTSGQSICFWSFNWSISI